ncbi:spore germination protein [Amedibacillus sp. YH-ame10]
MYEKRIQELKQKLYVDQNFDVVSKAMLVQNIHMTLFFVDGFAKDEILEKMMEFLLKADIKETVEKDSVQVFCDRFISYLEVDVKADMKDLITAVLSGSIVLMVEGYEEGIVIDARTYPVRGMEEPQDDKVLRGSRDGFVETLIFNTALIRRRIRDSHLRMEYTSVGSISKSDIVLCYMDGLIDEDMLKDVRRMLSEIQVEALTMAHESIAEALVPHKYLNPFPKVRYTERPDTASSNILEGKLILMIDNSPSVLILPTSFFDFIQEAQDYYLPPITGSYLRIIRILVFFITLLVTPVWFYLNLNPTLCPDWFRFTLIKDQGNVPIIVQLLLLEFGIDALKMASLNTPNSLGSTFSIIGALILGEFAINAGWLAPEIILYMAFVALADFTQPSFELGYAIKFMRIMILILTAISPRFGFWIGIIAMLCIMISNKTVTKTSYFYPLFPFNGKDFKMIFARKKLRGKSSTKS